MKRSLFALLFCLLNATAYTQGKIYTDSLEKFRAEYIATHEVVKGNDKTLFRFFPINKKFLVEADFEKITDTIGFIMKTSGKRQTRYFKYGLLSFTIDNKKLGLTVYQSEQLLQTTAYKNYLLFHSLILPAVKKVMVAADTSICKPGISGATGCCSTSIKRITLTVHMLQDLIVRSLPGKTTFPFQ